MMPMGGKAGLAGLVDAARADHFGCYGSDRPTTPNIDALAAQLVQEKAVRLDRAKELLTEWKGA